MVPMSARRVTVGAGVIALACISTAIAPLAVAAPAAASKKPSVAEIRVVALYAPPDGSQPDVVVVDSSSSSSKKKPKPLVTAAFGAVTGFTKVPTGRTLGIGPSDQESGILIDPLKKGDRITVVPYATSDDPEQSGMQMLTIVERGKRQKAGDVVAWPKVASAKATLMLFPGPLLPVLPEFGGFLVVPGEGCAESADSSSQDSGVGGSIPAFYVVDEGSVDVGLTDEGCDGDVVIGPETIDVTAGQRIALIPYGTSADDVQLLVLPVAKP
jgi:hypothetical protein